MTTNPFTLEDFQTQLNFPLDDFQKDAIRSISEGHSVVVCAPTGSGKRGHRPLAGISRIYRTRSIVGADSSRVSSNGSTLAAPSRTENEAPDAIEVN